MAPPTCFCGAAFGTHQHLKEHVQEKGHRFQCSCGSLCAGFSMLLHHRSESQVAHTSSIEYTELPALVAYQQNQDIDFVPANQCSVYDRCFANADGVKAHKADKHPECPTCHQIFNHSDVRISLNNLRRHQEVTGHCYCQQHDLTFRDARSYREHERREAHVTGFECLACDRHFGGQQGLNDHLAVCNASVAPAADGEVSERAQAVVAAVEEANLRCEDCNRDFMNIHAQRQHKRSVKHNPLSNLECFLSPRCRQVFTSPSAFILHLESGKCKSGLIGRQKLNDLIHAEDAHREITFASNASPTQGLAAALSRLSIGSASQNDVFVAPRGSDVETMASVEEAVLLTPHDSDAATVISESSGVMLTPRTSTVGSLTSTGGVVLTPPATITTRSEWDFVSNAADFTPSTTSVDGSSVVTLTFDNARNGWPCNLCGKAFRKKTHLIMHLNSPVHAPALYHCPPPASLGHATGKLQKSFKTLSGFAQHLEAGACTGGKEGAKIVVERIENVVRAATGRSVRLLRDVS